MAITNSSSDGNINDLDPGALTASPPEDVGRSPASAGADGNIHDLNPGAVQTEQEFNESTYGTTEQQALTAAEGLSRGVLGRSITAGIEKTIGIPGLSPEAQAGRESANPVLSGGTEAAGFLGSALAGTGEAALLGEVGEGARALTGLGGAGARALSKIAATGISTGAEFAALAADNEIARAINQDPGQTLGTAAINIGLAGIMGGAGGAVLGSVAPLWKTALNKIGVEKLASDFMGESQFLRTNPDPVAGAVTEINDRIASANQLIRGGLKKDLIEKLTQEVTPEKLDAHIADVSTALRDAPAAIRNEPLFQEAAKSWESKVSTEIDPITLQKTRIPTPGDVFSATENLKRQLQEFAEPLYQGKPIDVRDRPFVNSAARLASDLKESLENSKIWRAAADAQKAYNGAISPLFDIQKEFLGKFASKELGEKVADPTKINTYLNQAEKTKAGLKTNYVKNYLDQTQKAADAINKAYIENGLEQPLNERLNPTPILDHSLNTAASPGVSLARWASRGGAAKMVGHGAGELVAGGVGAGLGSLVGHPLVGAWMGERVLTPVFSALAKPLAQTAINSEAAKASVDYLGNIVRGQKLLKGAVGNFFKSGVELIPKEMLPDQASRDKLEKSLEYASAPENQMKIGGSIGHYLPDHATAAAQTASAASNYFAQIKPKSIQASPLDLPTTVDRASQAKYDRQLDVATQPLLVLKFAKEGRLQPQDLQTINSVYPGLMPAIAKETYAEMVKSISDGREVPYSEREGLSRIFGQPLDSTMMPLAAQTIIAANAGAIRNTQNQGNPKKASGAELKQINKASDLYATDSQRREMEKRS